MVGLEEFPDILRSLLEDDQHECSHQIAGIGLFVELVGAKVVDLHILVERVLHRE